MRSKEELVDYLSQRNQRRKRELASILARVGESQGDLAVTYGRIAIVFAYAHWEGCVQDCAIAYVRYATFKSRPIKRFVNPFRALLLHSHFAAAAQTKRRIGPHLILLEHLEDERTDSSGIDISTCIDTESNLTWEVFDNICKSIGVADLATWKNRGRFMDDLFRNRCAIAHGEPFVPDSKFPREAIEFVVTSIDQFSTQVMNMAINENFLRAE